MKNAIRDGLLSKDFLTALAKEINTRTVDVVVKTQQQKPKNVNVKILPNK